MKQTEVDNVIDMICHRGCRYVNSILTDNQAREKCPELLALDESQQHKVMNELKTVMSVYNQTGSCEF